MVLIRTRQHRSGRSDSLDLSLILFRCSLRRMIRFKNNQPGFSLMEVMIAVVIMALVFGAVLSMQTMLTQRVARASVALDRVVAAKDFLITSWLKNTAHGGTQASATGSHTH